jgi:signal transduction histidine kinase
VFYNVLDNAIKYTPRGGQITVRGRAVDDRVEIEIEDTGSGISPQHTPHVFKRFYRAEPARNGEPDGSGLGLAIAQSAIVAHGGTISIQSRSGDGTVVEISLPRVERQPFSPLEVPLGNSAVDKSGEPSPAS